ncbi:guided entry of tail-anchored proteins factor CAMLG-like [Haliotis rufescens]|uniref:guided entry of tail-anchored proteins factor CAMLG-like n=1 Tax=Haliotis rufescens TaxID=6454 RepID=UPI00201EF4F2|nr:guided entry of tail-anchored proteins factor CAMLG-like [Haliotis rufescens]
MVFSVNNYHWTLREYISCFSKIYPTKVNFKIKINMAELAARRDARRRKILQNSENRLNRLLGKPIDTEQDEASSPVSTDESERTTPSPTTPSPEPDVLRDTPSVSESPKDDGDTFSSHRLTSSLPEGTPVHPRPPLHSVREATATSHTAASQARIASSGQSTQKKQQVTQETAGLLQILENLRLGSCVLVAFFVRWVLSSGYGIFYFQSIFLPFVLLQVGLYSFHYTYMKDVALPHNSSLMSGALVLSGIKPEFVAIYNRTMGYFTAVTEDFALYLFTFLICNAVMT